MSGSRQASVVARPFVLRFPKLVVRIGVLVLKLLLEDWCWGSLVLVLVEDRGSQVVVVDNWGGQVLGSELVAEGTRSWGLDHLWGDVAWGGKGNWSAGNYSWGGVSLDGNGCWGDGNWEGCSWGPVDWCWCGNWNWGWCGNCAGNSG